ncbi:MAG: MoxR family ATPase [Thermaceae bacterium]|nr:MoxR family ATPase [Thermaceae bacterium]
MIWGPPGVGKSSIVAQTARKHGIGFIDVRLSQLAPTDLRGLPVPVPLPRQPGDAGTQVEGISKWYPPEFLPTGGEGILFLDELNMAPPTMQGMAQQLILDRKVGSYTLPTGWYVWAAGNRKEDRAAVFDMPAPLANRFVHLEVAPDFESFKRYGLTAGIHERILAFLSFRPALLHQMDAKRPAWPSPRSWEMASRLLKSGLDVAPVVGEGVAAELEAFAKVYEVLPELTTILQGQLTHPFPAEPSQRYALTMGLTLRAETAQQGLNAFRYLVEVAPLEWIQLFVSDLFQRLKKSGPGDFALMLRQDPRIKEFMQEYQSVVLG